MPRGVCVRLYKKQWRVCVCVYALKANQRGRFWYFCGGRRTAIGGVVASYFLLFETLDLVVASPAFAFAFAIQLVVVVVFERCAEVVAVAAIGLFALEAARRAGSDGGAATSTSTTSSRGNSSGRGRGGHGGERGGEREGRAGGGLGEHREARAGGVGGDGSEERLGDGVELCAGVERGHCSLRSLRVVRMRVRVWVRVRVRVRVRVGYRNYAR